MIRYSLACDAGHCFDSWFGDSAAFDDLAGRKLVSCPTCGSTQVAKTIMAPAVVTKRDLVSRDPANRDFAESQSARSQSAKPDGEKNETSAQPSVPVAATAATDGALLDDGHRELRGLIKAFREKVMAATQDVGPQFPEQARRMHDGDIPHRDIRGEATVDEARALLEDGIMILPVPTLPEEFN